MREKRSERNSPMKKKKKKKKEKKTLGGERYTSSIFPEPFLVFFGTGNFMLPLRRI